MKVDVAVSGAVDATINKEGRGVTRRRRRSSSSREKKKRRKARKSRKREERKAVDWCS